MRRALATIAAAIALVTSVGGSATAAPPVGTDLDANPAGRWIVLLKPGSDAVAQAASQGRKVGFKADRTYRHALRGYAAHLSTSQVGRLRKEASVAAVVPDEAIAVTGQIVPTGVSRVGAP